MVQVLKDELRERILEAAGSVFAEAGFQSARIADIAALAGTSTSNVYKYVKDKQDLFDQVVPVEKVEEHTRLLRARLSEFSLRADWQALDARRSERAAGLLRFWIENRHLSAILLARAEDTPFAAIRQAAIEEMTNEALKERPQEAALRFVLTQIFSRTLDMLAAILREYAKPAEIEAAIACFWRYQLAGLHGLLAPAAPSRSGGEW